MRTPDYQRLQEQAKIIEEQAYFPRGKGVDGSPYTAPRDSAFLYNALVLLFGGLEGVRKEILRIAAMHPRADQDCGNWWTWMILDAFGVARESPYDHPGFWNGDQESFSG